MPRGSSRARTSRWTPRRRKLSQAGSLRDLASKVAELVGGDEQSALKALGRADRTLSALEKADPETTAWREMMDGAFAQLQELARIASEYADGLSDDPARLADIERRRDLIYRLQAEVRGCACRRAGDSRDVGGRAGAARYRGFRLESAGGAADRRIGGAFSTCGGALREAAYGCRAARCARSNRLLPKLGLPGGKLAVALDAARGSSSSAGAESVRFDVRLNEGMDYRPLAKSASGGELSRLMLALKIVLGRHDAVPTLVFDEVDAGIGGEIGARVGEALGEVAERHQVLVITHLPQIAARADRHLVVAKKTRGGLATSDVTMIHGEDRVTELARMLGDPDGATARRHALALLGVIPSVGHPSPALGMTTRPFRHPARQRPGILIVAMLLSMWVEMSKSSVSPGLSIQVPDRAGCSPRPPRATISTGPCPTIPGRSVNRPTCPGSTFPIL